MTKVRIWSHTDIGRGRTQNQDYMHGSPELGLMVLADGMGGHKGGEVASQLAVLGLVSEVTKAVSRQPLCGLDDLALLLDRAFQIQNRSIYHRSLLDEQLEGMGCTLVAVQMVDRTALVANVGDSRCYLFHEESLSQVTKDHNLAQLQIDNGMSVEEAVSGRAKSTLLRAIGAEESVKVDQFRVQVVAGDWLVACSDGMTQNVSNERLEQLLLQCRLSINPARFLVEHALQAQTTDNVTVMVMAIDE